MGDISPGYGVLADDYPSAISMPPKSEAETALERADDGRHTGAPFDVVFPFLHDCLHGHDRVQDLRSD